MKTIGILTSGGDSPGMNACIRAVVKYALQNGQRVIGIEDGYQGMIENRMQELGYSSVNNIIQLGGTILGTARSEEFRTEEGRKTAYENLKKAKIDGLILIGGDGTFAGGSILSKECGIPVIGIPATIDNDIVGTDHTIGYDTCLNTVIDAIDKIRDTASSHHRIFFVEVMGRNAGFIALNAALASGAENVLIPEEKTDIEKLALEIKSQNRGQRSSIIIVAEGDDGGGAIEVMEKIRPLLNGFDLRHSILGHIQRGGKPSAFDRIIATRMGAWAVELLNNGENNSFIGVQGEDLKLNELVSNSTSTAELDHLKLELLKKLQTK
jgi:6-phosphofructokinase 1